MKAEIFKNIFRAVAVKILGKQRKKVYSKQQFGNKTFQISVFFKNHASKL